VGETKVMLRGVKMNDSCDIDVNKQGAHLVFYLFSRNKCLHSHCSVFTGFSFLTQILLKIRHGGDRRVKVDMIGSLILEHNGTVSLVVLIEAGRLFYRRINPHKPLGRSVSCAAGRACDLNFDFTVQQRVLSAGLVPLDTKVKNWSIDVIPDFGISSATVFVCLQHGLGDICEDKSLMLDRRPKVAAPRSWSAILTCRDEWDMFLAW
jgi:hypothetical protein